MLEMSKFAKLYPRYMVPFLCEKSGAIALVLPGLTTGWQPSRLAGRQNSAKFKNF